MTGEGTRGPSRRRRAVTLGVAAGLALAALLVLVASAGDAGDSRRFFGRWQSRYFLLAVALGLLACGSIAAAVSRRALVAARQIAGIAAISWLLLEALGLLGVVSYPELLGRAFRAPLGSRAEPHLDVEGVSYQDTALRWGLPLTPIPFRYRTDARGFRNALDRERADLYLLGDSILVAGLLPFEDTVTARLERALSTPVMNVSLIGISPQQEHALFRQAELDVEGALVLQVLFEGNDWLDSRRWRSGSPGADQGPPLSWAQRTLFHNVLMTLQRWSQPVLGIAGRRMGSIDERDYTFFRVRESWVGFEVEQAEIESELEAFEAEIQAAGGRYAVVLVPSKYRVLAPYSSWPAGSDLADLEQHLGPMPERLERWSERSGIPVLDLTEPLRAAVEGGRIPWFAGDTHPSPVGHEVMAAELARWPVVREHLASEPTAGSSAGPKRGSGR